MAEMYGEYIGAATKAVAITPHDTNEIVPWPRALYVGGTGNVKVKTLSDDIITFNGVPAGVILPVVVKMVYATGTSSSGIVGLI